MQKPRIIRFGFECMAKTVAKIQQGADSRLFFILGHDFRLVLHRFMDQVIQSVFMPLPDGCSVIFQPIEKACIVDRAVLDDFSQTGIELPFGKACKCRGVNNHCRWLVKSAHQVFAPGMVDCRFSADRGIHLGEQGGWKLQEADSTHVTGRCEARNIPYDPAPQRNYGGIPACLHTHELVNDAVPGFHSLEAFTIGDYVYFDIPLTQRRPDPVKV